jgi:hypothetical protein
MVVPVVETAAGLWDLQLLLVGREVVGVVEDPDIPIAMRLPDLGRTCIESHVTTINAQMECEHRKRLTKCCNRCSIQLSILQEGGEGPSLGA